MRKLIYHAAVSLDGFMARPDGSYDCFAMEGPHVDDFIAGFADYDTALMGRKTYDEGRKNGVTNPYPMFQTYVCSRSLTESPDPAVTLCNSDDLIARLTELKAQEGKHIWMVGAGNLAATLFKANLIDSVVVKLNPLILGEGISLTEAVGKDINLTLQSSKTYPNGVVLLSYEVAA